MTVMEAQIDEARAAEVRGCLAKILSCPLFAQAERQQRFLRYLVEQTLAGQANRLKGYTIGAEVFDRSEDFDPRLDAIVRVEATRLRSKLREYYDGHGSSDAIRIELPKGSYQLQFTIPTRDPGVADYSGPPQPVIAGPAAIRGLVPAVSVPSDRPSLAVLPFANMSSDPEQDYFADGIAEDLITALSKLSGMLVIGRHSAFVYKDVAKDARDIARELGVRYLLEGSVRRAGNRVRINTQLVEAPSGTQVWGERYDRELEDIFAVQDDVTRRIVEALEVRLSDVESDGLVHGGTANMEAHDFLLRGLERHWEYTSESVAASQALFAKAVEADPQYAAAHAWLARAYIYRYATDQAGEETLEIALRHAQRAIELNPSLPMSHSMLGWTQMWRGQSAEAINAARRAAAMDPNSPDAHLFLSVILASTGRGEEALQNIEKAMRLNPHPTAFYLFALGHSYFVLGRVEEAAKVFEAGVKLRPGFVPNREYLAGIYVGLGREAEAAAERNEVRRMRGPDFSGVRWQKFWLDKRLRDEDERIRARLASLP